MTAHKPETMCHRKIFVMRMTSQTGGASEAPHQAEKIRISQHPGHGIHTAAGRKMIYQRADRIGRKERRDCFSPYDRPATRKSVAGNIPASGKHHTACKKTGTETALLPGDGNTGHAKINKLIYGRLPKNGNTARNKNGGDGACKLNIRRAPA